MDGKIQEFPPAGGGAHTYIHIGLKEESIWARERARERGFYAILVAPLLFAAKLGGSRSSTPPSSTPWATPPFFTLTHTFSVLKSAFSVYFLHLYKQTLDDCFFFFYFGQRREPPLPPPRVSATKEALIFIRTRLIFAARFDIPEAESHWTVYLFRRDRKISYCSN
jgi:hypothetical protein